MLQNKEDFIGKVIDGKKYGIAIADLVMNGEREVRGLSGKSVLLLKTDTRRIFQLSDKREYYRVCCTIDEYSTLRILANTVLRMNGQRTRHPDLFAAQLITFFVHAVTNLHPDSLKMARSYWYRPLKSTTEVIEDNYEKYQALRLRKYSPRESALNTWTGQLFSSFGFTIMDDSDVKESKISVETLYQKRK